MAAITILPASMALIIQLFNSSLREVDSAYPCNQGWLCDLLWPVECSRTNTPGLRTNTSQSPGSLSSHHENKAELSCCRGTRGAKSTTPADAILQPDASEAGPHHRHTNEPKGGSENSPAKRRPSHQTEQHK